MIVINDNIQSNTPKPLDNKYMKFAAGSAQPYASAAEINSSILSAYRYRYLTVLATEQSELVEYWYKAGVADGDLEFKSKEVYVLNATGTTTFKAGYQLNTISIIATNNITNLQIGLTLGGTEIEPGVDVTAGETYTVSYPFYSTSNQTLHFTNVATGTKIIIRKSF